MDELDTLASHQLRHQAGFAVKVLERLANCDYDLGLPDTPSDLSIDKLRSKEYLLIELHSALLPLLRQHITSLSPALRELNQAQGKPTPTLKLVIEILLKLELTLDQTIRTLNDLIPGKLPKPSRTNDQHFKEFKCFRLRGFERFIKRVMQAQLATFFSKSRQLIETFTLPDQSRTPVTTSSTKAILSIDFTIVWLKGSELYLIYTNTWVFSLEKIDTTWDTLLAVADPSHPRHIELSRSFKPMVKLSKLFFKKIATEGMTNNMAPIFTEMSSFQLDLLGTTAEKITESLVALVSSLEHDDETQPNFTTTLIDHVKNLISQFQTCVLLTDLYIFPLLTKIKDVLSQIYYKNWIVTWNTLFYQATHNAIQACEAFQIR
ncbi:hypothetical protein PGTUg99_007625 [Puccinia graminis f. sp. tritici]|uniref:Uncharacterized protein n=1 Tax=Puccinia graminis f. sp. tritici TaxID=56615 RepID=A0A5B0S577_PUCGR|nr:hypothetical protein PGTUg99_007625 [Puccinia graminis f. sp. tritici]